MERTTIDLWVGIFVTAGLVGLLVLALKVGNASSVSVSDGYSITAEFDNIGGLKARAPVKSAGVVVGRVERIAFDNQALRAKVMMRIEPAMVGRAEGVEGTKFDHVVSPVLVKPR